MKLILASASQIRKNLLENAGFQVQAVPAHIDERAIEPNFDSENPFAIPELLAVEKAKHVSKQYPNQPILGADQILEFDGEILHKVLDLGQAVARLVRLNGKTHRLHTAAALVENGCCKAKFEHTSTITMHTYTEQEAQNSIAQDQDHVLGSVSAYRVEGPGLQLIKKIEGDLFCVQGLPLMQIIAHMRAHADSKTIQKNE